MNPFIQRHEYNFITKCLSELNTTLKYCADKNIIETNTICLQEKILGLFNNLDDKERQLLDITKIKDPLYIDDYLNNLYRYVYEFPNITNEQIKKIFKKEKKLKLPDLSMEDPKNIYLGWIDEAVRKLFIIYNLNGKFLGMSCRLPSFSPGDNNVCALCNHIGDENEITFVSPICKTNNKDGYKSLGFNICLDSARCNERITSLEKIENIIKTVNNIK